MSSVPNSRLHLIAELQSSGWLVSVTWYDSVDSTNSLARRDLDGGAATPALFIADEQLAGRGRSGRRWWSPTGCLMLTLAIGTHMMPEDPELWGQLALVCGVAVADTVTATSGIECELKWPNDVYIRGRKLAGILIEVCHPIGENPAAIDTRNPSWLIGIGLNVNLDWAKAPPELPDKATCLSRAMHRGVDSNAVLLDLLANLESWIVPWKDGRRHWLDGWKDRCLLTGRTVWIRSPQANGWDERVGVCRGLDGSGRLLLRTERGVEAFTSGEVVSWE